MIVKKWIVYLFFSVTGFLVGVFAIYVYWLHGGPSLQHWHTELLPAEFNIAKKDFIKTFDDYIKLEEKLFRQLNEEIYAGSETGPGFELSRYSPRSIADPRYRKPDWNRSFELETKSPIGGVLLLHGMSDSPYSLRALGQALSRRGYWVIGLRLPGHGTVPSALTIVTWEEMAVVVRLGIDRLVSRVGENAIHLVGFSTGAPLALNYALDVLDARSTTPLASLVLISPAIGISPLAALAMWQSRLAKLPGLNRLAWTQVLPEFDPYKYNSFTANAGAQVHRLTRSVAERIESRAVAPIREFPPTLAFLSVVDATVSTEAVIDNLFDHLAPGQHELVLFDINRRSIKSVLVNSDPEPLTRRLMENGNLPFHLNLITNESSQSRSLISRYKAPLEASVSTRRLNLAWPSGVVSLSHVALPFPPDDPIYGGPESSADNIIQLGLIDLKGERGLLEIPSDWLLRLRYNPFYDFLENRVIQWMDDIENKSGGG